MKYARYHYYEAEINFLEISLNLGMLRLKNMKEINTMYQSANISSAKNFKNIGYDMIQITFFFHKKELP